MDKTSFNVKFFDWDYLHLTALTKETYFTPQSFLISLFMRNHVVKYENLLLRTHVSLIHSQFPLHQKGPFPCGQLAHVSAVCLPQLTIVSFD